MLIQCAGIANSFFINNHNLMRTEAGRTVYELSVADLQDVAKEVLERELTDEEVVAVGNSVGDYIDWFQAIENAIYHHVRA
jgi:hypothetical protein